MNQSQIKKNVLTSLGRGISPSPLSRLIAKALTIQDIGISLGTLVEMSTLPSALESKGFMSISITLSASNKIYNFTNFLHVFFKIWI
jgi:hypothetical protein